MIRGNNPHGVLDHHGDSCLEASAGWGNYNDHRRGAVVVAAAMAEDSPHHNDHRRGAVVADGASHKYRLGAVVAINNARPSIRDS